MITGVSAAELPGWSHETAHLHRTAAGRVLRHAARRRPGHRGVGLRRVLPLRPLPEDGRASGLPGPTDAWITLAGLARETSRIRLGTLVSPVDLPAARPAGDHGRAGGPDERRPGRARARHRLVRRRAHRVRHPVPADGRAVRPARRTTHDRHRAVGHPRRRDVLLRRQAHYQLDGFTGAAQAGAAAASADHRWAVAARSALRGWPPSSPTSSTSRSRPLQARRSTAFGRVREAASERAGTRARSCTRSPHDCGRQGRGRGGAPCRGDRPVPSTGLRTQRLCRFARQVVDTLGRFAQAGADPRLPPDPGHARTSITWSSSRPRSCRRSGDTRGARPWPVRPG